MGSNSRETNVSELFARNLIQGGSPDLVIVKEGETSPWTSSDSVIPNPSSPLNLVIDGGSSSSTPPHGLNMVELVTMASKAIDESDTSSMAKLQNLKIAWFAKFRVVEPVPSRSSPPSECPPATDLPRPPVSLTRIPPPAADDDDASTALNGLPSRVSAPQETSEALRGVSPARVPAPPPSDLDTLHPRVSAPPALPEVFSGRVPSPLLTRTAAGYHGSSADFLISAFGPFGKLGPLNSRLPLHATPSAADPLPRLRPPILPTPSPPCRTDHQPPSSPKNVRSAPSNKGKEIAIHNSFQDLARSDDDDPVAPLVDPCPGTPSQCQPLPGVP
ncbi:hypothetical protein Salat_2563400 [Sesamum alatum]|uniref:Uncharacterized protein n=1 Tax=Sesamum alatum TaxID=300844 RepID=A0AAE2CCQ8_9LAMI|nr:hypothetical protein Salat_2563400 [Sesamum alatum]